LLFLIFKILVLRTQNYDQIRNVYRIQYQKYGKTLPYGRSLHILQVIPLAEELNSPVIVRVFSAICFTAF
jgi:hypothetical protein